MKNHRVNNNIKRLLEKLRILSCCEEEGRSCIVIRLGSKVVDIINRPGSKGSEEVKKE